MPQQDAVGLLGSLCPISYGSMVPTDPMCVATSTTRVDHADGNLDGNRAHK